MKLSFLVTVSSLIGTAALSARLLGWGAAEGTQPLRLEALDPAIHSLFSSSAKLEKLASGFKWTEGPVWTKQGFLLFAEIPSNSIRKWDPNSGVSLFMQPSGYQGTAAYGGPEPGSNGMTLDPAGRLNVAGHARREVWRLETPEPHAGRTVLADRYEGKKLNSPNDLVYSRDGSLYFTDPPYGNRTQSDHDPEKELSFNGVYRIAGASGHKPGAPPDRAALKLIIKDLPRPNGIAFSPDGKTLYIANSGPGKWMRYRVHDDGGVGEGELMADTAKDKRVGGPDGIKVDLQGNIYGTGPGGLWMFSPEGKHFGTLLLPERAGNLTFGGADGKWLYITASSSLYRIHTSVVGLRP